MPLLIRGGRLIDPADGVDEKCDILIEEGKVAHRKKNILPRGGDEIIDAAGLVVAPGFIDMHVHFREPGQEYKEGHRERHPRRRRGRVHRRGVHGEHSIR